MSHVATSIANRPAWFDLASPDLAASKQFYGRIFGWDAQQVAGPEGGYYTMFSVRGKMVAGLASLMDQNQPPAWTVYIGSDNVDTTAEAIRAAGGEIAMAPMDVMDAGRMCIFRDPTGAFAAVWQAGTHHGAEAQRETGTVDWVELETRDVPAAKRFYNAVFGWGENSSPMGPGQPDYTEWKLGDESLGGAMDISATAPPEMPANWLVYFRVENVDHTAAQIKETGGQVIVEPTAFPGGRFVVATDPHRACFGVVSA